MAALSKAVATPQGRNSEQRPKLRPGLKERLSPLKNGVSRRFACEEKLHGIHSSIYQAWDASI